MADSVFLLSGPSCAGKSPLEEALRAMHPSLDERLRTVTLYNSRARRSKETDGEDYHFRSREDIEALDDDDRFLVVPVRQDLQAVDLDDFFEPAGEVLHEGNVAMVLALAEEARAREVDVTTIFLSPLARREIERFVDDESFRRRFEELDRHRLLTRTDRQKDGLGLPALQDIERRVRSGWEALLRAHELDWVVPNHDGEDSLHWTAFDEPIGDARRATRAVAALIQGDQTSFAERWDAEVLARWRQ